MNEKDDEYLRDTARAMGLERALETIEGDLLSAGRAALKKSPEDVRLDR